MLQQTKTLVVEDNPDLNELMCRQIRLAGAEAKGALTGEEALEILKTSHFKVIFLDLHLPDMTGEAFARCLARTSPPPYLVAVTGMDPAFLDPSLGTAGINECLQKPISTQKIGEILQRVS